MTSSTIPHKRTRNLLSGAAAIALLTGLASASALAQDAREQKAQLDIPAQPLASALKVFSVESDSQVLFNEGAVAGRSSPSLKGNYSRTEALALLLKGTDLRAEQSVDHVYLIKPAKQHSEISPVAQTHLAQAASPTRAAAGIESVVVTSSKIKGDIQTVPIAITALSQEQLTSRQIAGGPDLVKEVPNLTFSKTNFSGYTIQIRGIGTQAISVTTDPAVAVAMNDIPFIRNHFFEQEFFDVNQVEVVRGPQGTLYGRNATAGVVNVITAKPTDQFEAMLSADWGNFVNRRYEGMINIPILDDRVDLRIAGEWTKRDGYTINGLTGNNVDGRDLWSSRVTLGWKPAENLQTYLVWEHFSENDDRMRTAKQLCHKDAGLTNVGGVPVRDASTVGDGVKLAFTLTTANFSQGCLPASLYSPESFQVPYGYALPYVTAGYVSGAMNANIDPYASTVQSPNLRVIETQIDPRYIAKNDTLEFNADYNVTPTLTFSSQTGYNQDFLWSTEDYNRFNTSPGIFRPDRNTSNTRTNSLISPYPDCGTNFTYNTASQQTNPLPANGYYYFGDPQLGCSDRLVAQDVSRERAWQFSQEFRIASNFKGPFNFSFGGNYMHYETVEDYYVFANALTLYAATSASSSTTAWVPGVTDNSECLLETAFGLHTGGYGHQYNDPNKGAGQPTSVCYAIDPNPLSQVNDEGHNYFLSRNPYVLNSYAGFGEAYYDLLSDLKLTGGIRWTDDEKHFIDIPSELLANGYGYMPVGAVDQKWNQLTGRFAANWSPKLDFTDQTLIYGSWAHGYKAGGANPPGAALYSYSTGTNGIPIHPLIFKPEFVDAYELGSKNTLLDGGLTLNGDVFFYNYKGYQISEIVDRTSINLNFDATVKGAELEATYEPLPGLKFNFAGGYEDTRIDNGQSSVDLMDRTAGHPGWVVMKPFVTLPSNCIFPDYVVAAMIVQGSHNGQGNPVVSACGLAYSGGEDPVTLGIYHSSWNGANDPSHNLVNGQPYYSGSPDSGPGNFGYPVTVSPGFNDPSLPTLSYTGYDPVSPDAINNGNGPAPNNGAGFSKNVGGNQLPNAPHFTMSLSGEYTMPVSEDWAATLHSDFYWQSQSFARVFNDRPYDKIRGYSNVNLALILTSATGWQMMGYLKNVFDTTAITGTFLNSDDSGLTTNVFLTDPRLYGVRVTKNW